MDDSSDRARELIARYRHARTLDQAARARVHARLVTSTAAAPNVVALPRRRLITVTLLALATAAAVILAARWAASPSALADRRPADADAAAFGRQDDPPQPTELRPAEPPSIPATPQAPVTVPPRSPAPQPLAPEAPAIDRPASAPAIDPVLAAELALVDAAKRALAAGDAALALDRLAEHARDFRRGQLAEERQALRVEALCAAGKRPQARAEATLFVREYPASTHADRIARACPATP